MTAMESGAPHMPMVVGLQLARAQQHIRAVIAEPLLTVRHSDTRTAPPGMVIEQQPPPGREVTPGSEIRLTVCANPAATDPPRP